MPEFDVDAERITVFRIGDEYLFAHYFDRTDVFDDLREYYNDDAYRFEVPEDEFDGVRDRLVDAYFEPVVVDRDDLGSFCVVKEKYTEHAGILRESVVHWERRGHLFFLVKSRLAVEDALERGATRLDDTEFVLGI